MCQFCHQHGEGKKWYLQAKNYAEELLDDARRREMIRGFFADDGKQLREQAEALDQLGQAPRITRSLITPFITRTQKRRHFGQVVPIEDVEEILDMMNQVVRVACVCRRLTREEDVRYCFGITVSPEMTRFAELVDDSFLDGPHGEGLEVMEKADALEFMREAEKDGLMHSVWTFMTPFIAGLCNCDRSDCLAMRATVNLGTKVMFRAEYVAQVDWDECTGCRQCMRVCQFGALGFSAAARKVMVDQQACYGCGVCRAVCAKGAMSLLERADVPEVANVW
ncbi:MAG: 4Fe-4S binding protein [Armatimonadota bacterium]|jgi:NAD-dependent dihydropyrimidine dehydrogenase PreA subunit